MQKYELALLFKPLLPEDIKKRVVTSIEELAGTFKGKLDTKQVWGKKHLAYPIKGHEEGFYMFCLLEIDPASLKDFQRELKLMADVLRFIVIKEEEL